MSPCYINLVWSGICLALICHQKNLFIFFFSCVESTLFISWWNRRIYLCSISTCLINIVHLIVKQKNLIWFYFHMVNQHCWFHDEIEESYLIPFPHCWSHDEMPLLLLCLSTTCQCLPRGHVSIHHHLFVTNKNKLFFPLTPLTPLTWRGKEYRSHI